MSYQCVIVSSVLFIWTSFAGWWHWSSDSSCSWYISDDTRSNKSGFYLVVIQTYKVIEHLLARWNTYIHVLAYIWLRLLFEIIKQTFFFMFWSYLMVKFSVEVNYLQKIVFSLSIFFFCSFLVKDTTHFCQEFIGKVHHFDIVKIPSKNSDFNEYPFIFSKSFKFAFLLVCCSFCT